MTDQAERPPISLPDSVGDEIAQALMEQYELLKTVQIFMAPSAAAVQIACARHQMKRAAEALSAMSRVREETIRESRLRLEEGTREIWALLYLHDWDPPRPGQEHKWEPGKNVFPDIHAVYHTWREAEAVRQDMGNKEQYWIYRARWEEADRLRKLIPTPPSDLDSP